jgi:hypothetical protein
LGEHSGDATPYHHFFAANNAATGKRLTDSPAIVNWTTANPNFWGGQSTVGDMFDLFGSTTTTTTAGEMAGADKSDQTARSSADFPNASDTPTARVLSALCAKTGPVLTRSVSGTTPTTSAAPAHSLVGFQLAGAGITGSPIVIPGYGTGWTISINEGLDPEREDCDLHRLG